MRSALEEVGLRERTLTIVVPDASVRVLLLDFDALPPKHAEALAIIRFRLRKQLPFEVDESAISYQVMQPDKTLQKENVVRAVVIATPAPVLAEYESAVREAGYEPGVVLPSTLAALPLLSDEDATLLINRNGNSVTTAIAHGNELLLHRTLELPLDPIQSIGELQRTVSVAVAYFEDTLLSSPQSLLYIGAGGAAELADVLGEDGRRVRDLMGTPLSRAGNAMPRSLLAGVVGALTE
jgi:type IV pilus assembly protein PilM